LKSVVVNTNDPAGDDDGTECFDFNGGGRPLSLASNATDGFGEIFGDFKFSGGIYFNNDTNNLYIGISGLKLQGPNAFALFIDATSGGQTNLTHLSTNTAPFGFSRSRNITFGAGFTPEVGLLLGQRDADGKNISTNVSKGLRSWGLYADSASGGSTSAAVRTFNSGLSSGETFSVLMDNGFIDSTNRVGFELQTVSGSNVFSFFFTGGSNNYEVIDGGGRRTTGTAYADEGVRMEFTLTATNTYSAKATRLEDNSTASFTGVVSGLSIQRFRGFNGGAGGGSQKDLFFNSMAISGRAFDNASDPAYPNSWPNGANGGEGFGAWSLTTAGTSAGHFTGNSINNGGGDGNSDGDIDGRNLMGQGVYNLSDLSNFSGFSSTGSKISQWARGYSGDSQSAQAGIEIALSLSALGASIGDTIKMAAMFIGESDGGSRVISKEVYGKAVSGSGFSTVNVIGAEIQLSGAAQTLPPNTYPGFTDNDAIIQVFYWDVVPEGQWYATLSTQYVDFASAGFTMAWLPPPQKCANPGSSVGYDPYDHYDLGQYSFQGITRTRYGLRSELTNVISKLLATNVMPICDIVLNHMAGGSNSPAPNTYNYPHGTFHKSNSDFHPTPLGHNDELRPYHNNEGFGSPNPVDVAFLTKNMRQGYKNWGTWLVISNGYHGWRFDLTEDIEPWLVNEWLHFPQQRNQFAFMEYWENADGIDMQEWIELTGRRAAIYDWNLRDNFFKPMCEENGSFDMNQLKAPSLLGLEAQHTVVFVENHDTFRPEFDGKLGIRTNREMAHAYSFHSRGLPLVFYWDYYRPPYYDTNSASYFGVPLKPRIDRLNLIRKKTVAGGVQYLSTNSDVFVQQRDGGGTKPGSILVMNDHPTATNAIQVKTIYTNIVLVDMVATNSPNSVTTDVSGVVTFFCPPRDYRIYSVTNALSQ
jgi:alpha-amylase